MGRRDETVQPPFKLGDAERMRPYEALLLPLTVALVWWSASREPFLSSTATDALLSLGLGLPLLGAWIGVGLRQARSLRAAPGSALGWLRLAVTLIAVFYLGFVAFGFLADVL